MESYYYYAYTYIIAGQVICDSVWFCLFTVGYLYTSITFEKGTLFLLPTFG
jgi:hypothetical protein